VASSPATLPTHQHPLGPFATSGKLTDTTTGITILGARAYNATEGRFLSVDPVAGGCANAYVYAFGDPINSSDLTGKDLCHEFDAQAVIDAGQKLVDGANVSAVIDGLFGSSGEMPSYISNAIKLLMLTKSWGAYFIEAGEEAKRQADLVRKDWADRDPMARVRILISPTIFGIPTPISDIFAVSVVRVTAGPPIPGTYRPDDPCD
jgi:RHS repeat-associated protein